MKTYYIYHIPGLKYGCTQNYPDRPASQSDVYELIEQHLDIIIASEREKILNIEAGYPWQDTQYYYKMLEMGSKGSISQLRKGIHNFQKGYGNKKGCVSASHQYAFSSAGGKSQSGIPKPHAKDLAKQLNVEWKCQYCNKIGKGKGNFKRYGHYNNTCKKLKETI